MKGVRVLVLFLTSYVFVFRPLVIELKTSRYIIMQVADISSGLEYLHSEDVVHCDLKCVSANKHSTIHHP